MGIAKFNMPMNEEGKPRGIAIITFETDEGVKEALKYDGDEYGGRTLKVNKAGEKGKGKGKDGKGKRDDSLTVFVGGLPFSADEETLKKDFAECGEIDRFNMPMNEEGRPRGIAFITYKSEEAVTKALEFNETDYGGRTIKVNKAGDRPAGGKDGKGKDGKGKGKDKDGKGKGKKGKK